VVDVRIGEASGSTTVQHMRDEQGSITIVRDYEGGAVVAMRVYFDGELATEKEHEAVRVLLESATSVPVEVG
jgi:hypothetical protein